MAIPSGTKFRGISAGTKIKERGSKAVKGVIDIYTIEEFVSAAAAGDAVTGEIDTLAYYNASGNLDDTDDLNITVASGVITSAQKIVSSAIGIAFEASGVGDGGNIVSALGDITAASGIVSGVKLNISGTTAPVNGGSSTAGAVGDMMCDGSNLYVCTTGGVSGTAAWKSVAIAAF